MIQLKKGREKSLRRRHPWIFSGAIERVTGKPGSGDSVEVRDASGQPLAQAAFSPKSQIRRSEEHTSELQSPCNLVCRLLLEKKKNNYYMSTPSYMTSRILR